MINNDFSPPDLLGELISEEKIHTRDTKYLSERERTLVKQRVSDYYKHNKLLKLIEIVKFQNPQFALNELIGESLRCGSDDKLWLYIDIIQPG